MRAEAPYIPNPTSDYLPNRGSSKDTRDWRTPVSAQMKSQIASRVRGTPRRKVKTRPVPKLPFGITDSEHFCKLVISLFVRAVIDFLVVAFLVQVAVSAWILFKALLIVATS